MPDSSAEQARVRHHAAHQRRAAEHDERRRPRDRHPTPPDKRAECEDAEHRREYERLLADLLVIVDERALHAGEASDRVLGRISREIGGDGRERGAAQHIR